jgi:hypothetical protein
VHGAGGRGGETVEAGDALRRRAAADAEVITGLLDAEQRRRYARSSDRSLTAQLLESERHEVLSDAPPPNAQERESAEAALAADARTRRWAGHEARAQCGVLSTGTIFLVGGGLGLLLRSEVLTVIGAIALPLSGLLLGVQFFWRRRVSARRLRVLVDWASHSPGQLGRGVPLPLRTARTSLWSSDLAQKLMTIVTVLGLGLLGIGIWVLAQGQGLAEADGYLGTGGVITGAGAVFFLAGPLAHRAARRRDAALEWLPSSPDPDDEAFEDDDWDDVRDEGRSGG